MIINDVTDVLFAYDTSVWIMDKNYEDFKQKVKLTLFSISQRFDDNQLILNII